MSSRSIHSRAAARSREWSIRPARANSDTQPSVMFSLIVKLAIAASGWRLGSISASPSRRASRGVMGSAATRSPAPALAADVQADRGGNGATHGSGECLAPGTGQPGDAQHLAAADVEVDARDRRAAQAADLEHGLSALGLRRGGCGSELELLANDQAREPPAVDAGRRD